MLEITVWDQPRVQEEESEFLGEVRCLGRCESALGDVSALCVNSSRSCACFGKGA